jgi:hypothetical protein
MVLLFCVMVKMMGVIVLFVERRYSENWLNQDEGRYSAFRRN